jgi:transcription antitermination factor NusG
VQNNQRPACKHLLARDLWGRLAVSNLEVRPDSIKTKRHCTPLENDLSEKGEALSEWMNQVSTAQPASDQPRYWFAVYAHSRHEKTVDQKLKMREIDSFLPMYKEARRWKNGCRHELDLPLFPNYLFVRIGKGERARVLEVPGVISLVGSGPQLSPVPDQEIERLRDGISHRHCEPHPYLKAGQKARIVRGALEGLTGVLVRKKNQYRVVLSLDTIMRSVAVDVDVADIEAMDSTSSVSC